MAGEVIEKAYRSVGALAHMIAVDPDITVSHHAVERYVDAAMGIVTVHAPLPVRR
jgi:hypothetical protein